MKLTTRSFLKAALASLCLPLVRVSASATPRTVVHPLLGPIPVERATLDWRAEDGDLAKYLYCAVDRHTGRRLAAEGYRVVRAGASGFRHSVSWVGGVETLADFRRPVRIVLKACIHDGVYRPDLPPDWRTRLLSLAAGDLAPGWDPEAERRWHAPQS